MKKWWILIFSLVLAFLPGLIGGLFTADGVDSEWYLENKPGFTPPGYVFGPVWTVLYLLIGLSLYLALVGSKGRERKVVVSVFVINLVLNGFWSYLFFSLHNPLLAFVDLALLWFSILALIFLAGKIDRRAGWLLVPYLLWVGFAGVLNAGFF